MTKNKLGIPDQQALPSRKDDFFQSFLQQNTLPQLRSGTDTGDLATPLVEEPTTDHLASPLPLLHPSNPDFPNQPQLSPTHSLATYQLTNPLTQIRQTFHLYR